MPATKHADRTIEPPENEPTAPSRRALLTGMLGGIGALAATVIGGASRTEAAAGSTMIIGSSTNNAGTSNTILTTSSNVVAFELIQNGPGTALMGYVTPGSGTTRGVYGRTDSPNGDGVQARNAGAAGTGAAVRAFGGNNDGLVATTDSDGNAIWGVAAGTNGIGVKGEATNGYGLWGYSGPGVGVYGVSGFFNAIYGYSPVGKAGYFDGDVSVTDTLTKGGGSFLIDHPLDPARRTLAHSFVESPDMKNVYDGMVTTDGRGKATVELPAYFGALNRDFRYQLTSIGSFARAMVSAEVADNRFSIHTDEPNTRVSWQVTGIRQDAWANAHRIVVEADKPAGEAGTYLHATEHGKPESSARDYAMRAVAAKAISKLPIET